MILLLDFDFDAGLVALGAFSERLKESGTDLPYSFALPPNSGQPTGIDIDGDGRRNGPADSTGYGEFPGQGGMAVLSRLPILQGQARDYSLMKWEAMPGADLSAKERAWRLPFSSTAHWLVPLELPDNRILNLLAWHATTPAFDDEEDRNGRRNHAENLFWLSLLDGVLDLPPPADPFVLLGSANLDPADGDGQRGAIHALLADPRLQDPLPRNVAGAERAKSQGGVNLIQKGDPELDTSDWADASGPGNLRTHYVLPSSSLTVLGSGIYWPAAATDGSGGDAAPARHGMVWVDIAWQ